jgi:hypothetical protein
MGIYLLNSFLKSECKDVIQNKYLFQFKNKKIVIDTSIYLYIFSQDDKLLENFYDLCSALYSYNIKPLFVFDGKPTSQKNEELNIRKEKKKKAKTEYDELMKQLKILEDENIDNNNEKEIQNIKDKMFLLKRHFIKITSKETDLVKDLITSFGMKYTVAPYEADALCCYLCKYNIVYACLSEDTDMFVYGCPRIMKNFNIKNNCFDLYNIDTIVKHLHMSFNDFQMLSLLCDNDYYKNGNNMFYIYKKYLHSKKKYKTNFDPIQFIHHIQKNENMDDYLNIYDIYNIFNYKDIFEEYKNICIENSNYDLQKIYAIMKEKNFYIVV